MNIVEYTHSCALDLNELGVPPIIGDTDQRRFLYDVAAHLERILLRTGPRRFHIRLLYDDNLLKMVLVERHGVRHLLARLFWFPLDVIRGRRPWQLRLDRIEPVEMFLMCAVGKTCKDHVDGVEVG